MAHARPNASEVDGEGPLPVLRCALVTALAVALAVATFGCGDPPPDPAVAPIEIVAGSRARPTSPCLLNRASVAPGMHEIVAIAESSSARVRLQDEHGTTLFDETVERGSSAAESVVLEAGPHRVMCTVGDGSELSVSLDVHA